MIPVEFVLMGFGLSFGVVGYLVARHLTKPYRTVPDHQEASAEPRPFDLRRPRNSQMAMSIRVAPTKDLDLRSVDVSALNQRTGRATHTYKRTAH